MVKVLFIFKGYLHFRNVYLAYNSQRHVWSGKLRVFKNCYKDKFYYNLPPNTIALSCTAVQHLDLFLLSSVSAFCSYRGLLLFFLCWICQGDSFLWLVGCVGPPVCRERYQSIPHTPLKLLTLRYQTFYQSQEETYQRRNNGASAEIYHFPL